MPKSQKGSILIFLSVLIIFLVVFLVAGYIFVAQPFKIVGRSMSPTLPDGQLLVLDKLSYKFNNPERGEIVIYKYPGSVDTDYIGRIIGLPGEKIILKEGRVYINDQFLNETYLEKSVLTEGGEFLRTETELTIPEGNYIILGDNRPKSNDSRTFGPVPRSNLIGKLGIKY